MHFWYKQATIAAVIGQRPTVPIQTCNCLQRGPHSQMLAAAAAAGGAAAQQAPRSCNPSMEEDGCWVANKTSQQPLSYEVRCLRKSGSPTHRNIFAPFGGAIGPSHSHQTHHSPAANRRIHQPHSVSGVGSRDSGPNWKFDQVLETSVDPKLELCFGSNYFGWCQVSCFSAGLIKLYEFRVRDQFRVRDAGKKNTVSQNTFFGSIFFGSVTEHP
jgi:hypothetical protein